MPHVLLLPSLLSQPNHLRKKFVSYNNTAIPDSPLPIYLPLLHHSFSFINPLLITEQSIERYKSWKALHSSASPTEVTDVLDRTQRIFNSLKPRDIKLIKVQISNYLMYHQIV